MAPEHREVEVDEARAVLGVAEGSSEADERSAFRRRLRATHPDVAGPRPDAGVAVARLIRALAVLRSARAAPDRLPPPARRVPPTGARPEGDSILLDLPADEAFLALVEAAHDVGELTYADPDMGLLETIVVPDGTTACSLLLTLQGRASGTEVFCTLEPLGATPSPPLHAVVAGLAAALRR
jgi:hypothetical protein